MTSFVEKKAASPSVVSPISEPLKARFQSQLIVAAEFAFAAYHRDLKRREPLPPSPQIQTLDWTSLSQNQPLFQGLVDCYRQGYGAAGEHEWGEGAYCSQSGWSHLVDLDRYHQLLSAGKPVCPHCQQGTLSPCYPPEHVKDKVKYCLNHGSRPTCVVKTDPSLPGRVVGFCWGSTCTRQQLTQRLGAVASESFANATSSNPDQLSSQLQSLSQSFPAFRRPTLYIDEILLLKSARSGPSAIMDLTKPVLQSGVDAGAQTAVFWTSPDSNIYPLTKLIGFTPFARIGQHDDHLVLMYHPNLPALSKFVSTITPKEMRQFLVKSSRRSHSLKKP